MSRSKSSLKAKSPVSKERNYGIDLLRIISMIMIPTLHVLGHGGILDSAEKMSVKYDLAWLLEIACYCASNVYSLISGYVGYGRKTKYSNIIYLYFQVVFYTVCTTVIAKSIDPALVKENAIQIAFSPVSKSTYWYFSAYFCLFFVAPFLDILVDKCTRKQFEKLLLSLFVVFSLLPAFLYSDFGKTNAGYSFLWLAMLYLVGAYIKKYDVKIYENNNINLLLYAFCVLFTWLSKIIGDLLVTNFDAEPKGRGIFITYTSPTVVLCSVFLLVFFANIKCRKATIAFVKFFAPVSFGVYLFHEEPIIRDNFIKHCFIQYLDFQPVMMILAVIGTALLIWLVGSLVDRVRLLIFDILHVKQFCGWTEKTLRNVFGKIENKIDKNRKL